VNSAIAVDNKLAIEDLGLIEYQSAWQLQKQIQQEVIDFKAKNTLLLLEHPSVYTAGRRTEITDRPIDDTPVIDVDRGGKITWHGPGQIVGYPILRLKNSTDVVGFVRELESSLIEVCEYFGIKAERYCERSGVWIRDINGDRKIAAIGLRVAKGVTMHGFALNVNPNLSAYEKIIPCGIAGAQVTSFEKELDRAIQISEVKPVLQRYLLPVLERVSQ
jgi:lipoyl(octanoyl) transferase